ncbi:MULTISPECIES: GtrA family protein [Ramlibacter]|uniref:GtrA family protein n=1 Tax=Ramlibacter aquaticus TaxID=2780094 RepID=A0ABR9SGH9_9BURK|nr:MULTISPECIES: GtrA family protein [Ramlibacter]MBE7941375.1 GtrA family protein [Ramlibacter aquaticus]
MMGEGARILRFGLVGALGFVVDAGVLQLLVWQGWNPVAGRAVSIPLAVLATWALNRGFTFREARGAPALPSLLRYAGVSAAGAAVNFGVYSALVLASAVFGAHPVLPLAVASGIAMLVNYLGSRHFAFRAGSRRPHQGW